jgi:hypothetical protein
MQKLHPDDESLPACGATWNANPTATLGDAWWIVDESGKVMPKNFFL